MKLIAATRSYAKGIVLSGYKFGKGWALDMLKVPETGAS
jgi:hypothetical protein